MVEGQTERHSGTGAREETPVPSEARWLGFDGSAGIHGTEDVGSLGTAASHGCIRLAVPGVVDLYRHVDVGTPVYIS